MKPGTRIAFLPAGTMDVASSRLRCYGLARELAKLGYLTQIGYQPGQTVDVLFVQKRIDENILAVAKAVKAQGGRVIYDIDDYGDALAWLKVSPEVHAAFIAQCDVICVDTDVRHEVFAKDPVHAEIPERWIIPDPVDYIGLEGVAHEGTSRHSADGELTACWFGNAPNVVPALPYLEVAHQHPAIKRIDIISNKEFVGKLSEMLPNYHVEAWSLDTFPARLRDTDFCLLIHDTGIEGVQKSNNKMLAALALGVIPFASRTPAYEKTAIAMGLEAILLDRSEDLAEKLAPEKIAALRAAIAAPRCQNELAQFLPANVATEFARHVEALLARPQWPARSSDKKLTIVTHYYNNDAALKRQVATWRSYPREVLDQIEFVVIDDYSDAPHTADFRGLPVRAFRVQTDIEWNQGGCRNLGMALARTAWVLIYDVDHIIARDHILRLLNGLDTLDKECLYRLARRENGQLIDSHVNSFLAGRTALLASGGYDEDFCGHYGYEDTYFLYHWQQRLHKNIVMLTNVELEVEPHSTSRLDRDLSRNRALMEAKLQEDPPRLGTKIRFDWAEVPTPTLELPASTGAPIRLNLGSGEQPLPGYINVDLSTERKGHLPDVNCDIRDLRGVFPDNYADEVLAVHVVEHMWRWEVVAILKEWVRVLKPGGTMILECPNLISACEALLKDPAAGSQPDQRGSKTMWCFYGDPNWQDPLMCHRWLYTPQSLAQVMSEAGLGNLRQEPAQFKAREPRDMRIAGTKPAV